MSDSQKPTSKAVGETDGFFDEIPESKENIKEKISELKQGNLDEDSVAKDIALRTVPGPDNSGLLDGLTKSREICETVLDELNNWIYIVDCRVYSESVIGISAKYRWTIKRWGVNETDSFLLENGWENNPHRFADSRFREEDEMEARYSKKIDGINVHINIHVEFPQDILNEMSNKSKSGEDEMEVKQLKSSRDVLNRLRRK